MLTNDNLKWKEKSNIFAFVVMVGVVLLVYKRLLSSDSMLVQGDGLGVFNSGVFWIDSIKNGDLPLWNPYSSIGMPFLADVQSTVFNPLNILFFFFEPVLAFNLSRIIQLVVAGCFMYLLMRELFCDVYVSTIVGVICEFSIIFGGARIEHHTIITTLSMVPMILYFLEKFRRSNKEKWLVFSSICMTIQFYAGFTQICLYFDIVLFFWILYILRENKYSVKKGLILVIKWGAIYLLLISIQLIPLIHLMLQSGRNEITWDYFSLYAYDLRILLMMFFPYAYSTLNEPFGGYHSSGIDIEIYIGIICMIYITYIIRYHWRDKKVKLITTLTIGLFVYGMGPNIPILGQMIYHIPLLNSFRCCARTLPLAVMLLLILFGLGINNLKLHEERGKIVRVNWIFIFLISSNFFVLSCILSQNLFVENEQYIRMLLRSMLVALLLCVANILFLKVIEKKDSSLLNKILIILTGILIVTDISRFSVPGEEYYIDSEENLSMGVSTDLQQLIDVATDNSYRIFGAIDTGEDYYRQGVMNIAKCERARYWRKYVYNNYITFIDKKLDYWGLSETVLFGNTVSYLNSNNDLISMLGIKYILDDAKHNIEMESQANYIKIDNIDPEIEVYDNINARQILYIPEYVYSIKEYGENWNVSGMEQVDRNNYIVNYGKNLDLTQVETSISDIEITNNSVCATVTSNGESFLNLSMLSYPGWKAYVDGKKVPNYVVNNLIQGIEIPKGIHKIQFVFDPLDIKIGMILTGIGIALGGYWLLSKNRKSEME